MNKKEDRNPPKVCQPFIVDQDPSIFVCIASGPSLTQEQIDIIRKYKKEKSLTVISVNDNWKWKSGGDFISDHCYAADPQWWFKYIQEIKNSGFDGTKWIPIKAQDAKKLGINMIPCEHMDGLGKAEKIRCGKHSGYQAIGLAYFLGATKIILVGYDMKTGTGGKIHWFGNHPVGLRNTPNRYNSWIQNYDRLAKDLKAVPIDVVNCSTDTAITQFRKEDLEKELTLS